MPTGQDYCSRWCIENSGLAASEGRWADAAVPLSVGAAHQDGSTGLSHRIEGSGLDGGRNVAQGQTAPAAMRAVWQTAVDEPAVVNRSLPGA